MGSFDQNSSYIPPFFAVFAQTLGQFPQNVGFCPDFLYIAHLGIPEIWAIARKDEFAQKSIFRWRRRMLPTRMERATLLEGTNIGQQIVALLEQLAKHMLEDSSSSNNNN
jgi:hypothetical protein